MTADRSPQRVRAGHVAWLRERLSERDLQILEAVNRLHLVTGWQLDRLFFANLAGRSRIVTRSRTLVRLTNWRVLKRLPRRIGGSQRGSSVAVYALGPASQRLLVLEANDSHAVRNVRQPSERFSHHILAVSELYVELVESERRGYVALRQFVTEPACWWPNGRGGWLKPDTFVATSNGHVDQLWWVEVDRATESVPTIGRKLRTYLDFVNRGGLGPRDAIPRVLVTVPNMNRCQAIRRLVDQLPAPADELFAVVLHGPAVALLELQLATTESTRKE